jgi:multifunctional 2-oxoglutarate metabolism enzyme
MYKLIDERRSVRKLYLERLVNTGEISMETARRLLEEFRGLMEQAFSETRDSAARTAVDVPVAPEPPALPVTSVPGRVSTR